MESPKVRFFKNDLVVKKAATILHSIEFEQACDVAMLEFTNRQPLNTDSAVADALRAQGARMYRDILENLADESAPIKRTEMPSLNYQQ
jgi:hypothetical protein